MADIITSNRLPPNGFWQYAGVPGGIPDTSSWTVTAITGLDTTGNASAVFGITGAIATAAARTILTISTGTFLIDSRITLKNDIVLRGAKDASFVNLTGAQTGDCTVFRISGVAAGLFVGVASSWGTPTSVTGFTGYSQTSGVVVDAGVTGIMVTSTAGMSVDKMIRIIQQNNSGVPILSVYNDNQVQGQEVMLKTINGTTLGFSPPLGFPLYSGLGPTAAFNSNIRTGIGVENIFFDGSNQTGQSYHINLNCTHACWISGVNFFNAMQYMHYWNRAIQCEFRHSTTWLERNSNGSYTHGPNMAGFKMDTSCHNLIVDNIFYRQFPSVQINGASGPDFSNSSTCGNVVAYNLSIEPYDANSDPAQDFESSHGPHCQYDLYEGNIADQFSMDAYYGSASNITVLRNWLAAANQYNLARRNMAFNLDRFARNYNLVGNLVGKVGYDYIYSLTTGTQDTSKRYIYRFGYPNVGNSSFAGSVQPSSGTYWADWNTAPGPGGFQELDLDVEATTLYKGNYIVPSGYIAAGEALGSSTVANSYVYSSQPSWWPNSLTWPPFDPLVPNAATGAIPAGFRYLNGYDSISAVRTYRRLGRHLKLRGLASS